jgi:hypothetical protein
MRTLGRLLFPAGAGGDVSLLAPLGRAEALNITGAPAGANVEMDTTTATTTARAKQQSGVILRPAWSKGAGLRLTMPSASSSPIGEGICAAEVLGYFWDAEYF